MKKLSLKEEELILGIKRAGKLYNSGGPNSRQRTEPIQSDFLDTSGTHRNSEIYRLSIPEDITDIEAWLVEHVLSFGWNTLDEAIRKLPVPTNRMMAFAVKDEEPQSMNSLDIVLNALILAKTNDSCYNPESPLIFTKKRMNRTIKLVEIDINKYYELD